MSSNGHPVKVPALSCPIAPAIHDRAAELEESAISWMWGHGYISNPEEEQRARAARFGTLAALAYP